MVSRDDIVLAVVSSIVGVFVQAIFVFLTSIMGHLDLKEAFIMGIPLMISIIALVYLILWMRRSSPRTDGSTAQEPTINEILNDGLKSIGVIEVTTKLDGSQFVPSECIKRTDSRLWFMGILGSKWITPHYMKAEFEQFIKRIQLRGGEVRFLLINPKSDSFKQLRDYRDGAISTTPLHEWTLLVRKYNNTLKVRLYDHLPCFRIVILDNDELALSRYKIHQEGHFESKYGWENPHLVFNSKAPWSFAYAFELYYKEEWQQAKSLLREDYSN